MAFFVFAFVGIINLRSHCELVSGSQLRSDALEVLKENKAMRC